MVNARTYIYKKADKVKRVQEQERIAAEINEMPSLTEKEMTLKLVSLEKKMTETAQMISSIKPTKEQRKEERRKKKQKKKEKMELKMEESRNRDGSNRGGSNEMMQEWKREKRTQEQTVQQLVQEEEEEVSQSSLQQSLVIPSTKTMTPSKNVVVDPEERYRRYAGAVTLQTQWRGRTARSSFNDHLSKKRKHERLLAEAREVVRKEEEKKELERVLLRKKKEEVRREQRKQEEKELRLKMVNQVRSERERQAMKVQTDAAIDLQRVVRGKQGRRKTLERIVLNDSASNIQKHWRRKSEVESFKLMKAKNELTMTQHRAATVVQSNARRRQARVIVNEKRQLYAINKQRMEMAQKHGAMTIQARYRGKLQYSKYIEVRDEQRFRSKSILRVQSLYRGHLSRRLLTIFVVAATRIQRLFRYYIIRQKWLSMHIDVKHIVAAEKLLRLDMMMSDVTMSEKSIDRDGNDALMLASKGGSLRLVRLCLGSGYTPSSINTSDKQTCLHLAASIGGGSGRDAVATLLLDAGADIHATDSLGRSSCHIAAASGADTLLKILCDRPGGAPMEVTDRVSGGR